MGSNLVGADVRCKRDAAAGGAFAAARAEWDGAGRARAKELFARFAIADQH